MSISISWGTKIIFVPKSDTTLVQSVPTEIRSLDINVLRLALKGLEESDAGITFEKTHNHNTTVLLSGVTYARVVEIINGYTITFEDGQYAVNLIGANSNIGDVTNVNQVSIRVSNSAGLAVSTGAGVGTVAEVATAVWNASAATYNVNGSMGQQLNAAPTAVEIADRVRVELDPELTHILTLSSNPGLTPTQATMLLEMYELLGLDPTKPLLVTSTSRSAGSVDQSIYTDASQTLVTRI